jgi:uncharacterized protein YfbU (UPF0304 family)
MATERFEMRIDSELLERLDAWGTEQEDRPSRAEAVRRLLELGLSHGSKGRAPHFTDGEKLITLMLTDLLKGLNVETETNIDLVRSAIYGGHYWALGWEMPGVYHGHNDKESRVSFVVDVLDMWSFLEEGYEVLSDEGKEQLAKVADPFGAHVKFLGFDGNNEAEYMSIATFLVRDLDRFTRFKDRSFNSHSPTLVGYGRMVRAFEPIRATLIGRRMTVDELATVLNARKAN